MDAPLEARWLVAAGVAALGLAACAGATGSRGFDDAAAAPTPPTVSFTQADRNGDARIDRREFDLWRRERGATAAGAQAAAGGSSETHSFDAADTNANGVLTLDEWEAIRGNAPAVVAAPRTRGVQPAAEAPEGDRSAIAREPAVGPAVRP